MNRKPVLKKFKGENLYFFEFILHNLIISHIFKSVYKNSVKVDNIKALNQRRRCWGSVGDTDTLAHTVYACGFRRPAHGETSAR